MTKEDVLYYFLEKNVENVELMMNKFEEYLEAMEMKYGDFSRVFLEKWYKFECSKKDNKENNDVEKISKNKKKNIIVTTICGLVVTLMVGSAGGIIGFKLSKEKKYKIGITQENNTDEPQIDVTPEIEAEASKAGSYELTQGLEDQILNVVSSSEKLIGYEEENTIIMKKYNELLEKGYLYLSPNDKGYTVYCSERKKIIYISEDGKEHEIREELCFPTSKLTKVPINLGITANNFDGGPTRSETIMFCDNEYYSDYLFDKDKFVGINIIKNNDEIIGHFVQYKDEENVDQLYFTHDSLGIEVQNTMEVIVLDNMKEAFIYSRTGKLSELSQQKNFK